MRLLSHFFHILFMLFSVLDLADTIGSFGVGKKFDALVVDVTVEGSQIDLFEGDTLDDIFQKFIYLGE